MYDDVNSTCADSESCNGTTTSILDDVPDSECANDGGHGGKRDSGTEERKMWVSFFRIGFKILVNEKR